MGVCTGKFQYANGSPVANGLYQFKLSQDAIQVNTACIAPALISGNLDSSGNMTATFLFNDVLSTSAGATTAYQLTVKSSGGSQVWNENYYFTGTSANVNLILPSGTPSTFLVGVATTSLGSVGGNVTATVGGQITNISMTLTANSTLALAPVATLPNGAIVTFQISQDVTGGWTLTWPSNVNAMVVGSTALQSSNQIFYYTNGTLVGLGPGLLNP